MATGEVPPDHLRCRRTDGRQWRCKRLALDGKKLCEAHYLRGKHRSEKVKDSDSAKPVKKEKKESPKENNGKIRVLKGDRGVRLTRASKGEKRKRGVSEALDKALKRMKLKRGDLPLELIREFLKRQAEKKKKKELRERDQLTHELPNGVMAIPASPSQNHKNADNPLDVKLGHNVNSSPFSRRHFRSKNIEPLPISTMQAVPFAANLRNKKRKKCHWCRRSSYNVLIKCSSCKKQFFCMDCIKERYLEVQQIKVSCPVCSRTCICRICAKSQSEVLNHKEFYKDKRKVDKIQLLSSMIFMLLPVLKQINKDQRTELEIEAKITGKNLSDVKVQPFQPAYLNFGCCYCSRSILDYHRGCAKCSYKLCLDCCLKVREGGFHSPFKSKESHGLESYFPDDDDDDDMLLKLKKNGAAEKDFQRKKHSISPKIYKSCTDGSISCPPTDSGGCGGGLLDLRCVFPFCWIKELEVMADKVLSNSKFLETSDATSCCSICNNDVPDEVPCGKVHTVIPLYCPSGKELLEESLEHFQKHWGKGHPVVVRNVLRNTPDLMWDPVAMFSTYLDKSSGSLDDKEAAKKANCLDWCEVEISTKQILMGSLECQTHATMRHQMLKFKAWLSSHLFQLQFPEHYSEVLGSLPLREYINPITGIVNLASKLPRECPQPDLGPCVHISYGSPEEIAQSDFLTNLCYNSTDMVNILAYATDIPVSSDQLSKVKELVKKYKTRDVVQSASSSADQKGKSSLHSEETEESGLQDLVGEDPNSSPAFAKNLLCSSNGQLPTGKDGINSADDSDIDSDASIHCSGIIDMSEDSDRDYFFLDNEEDSSAFCGKQVADAYGAEWDIFQRQDVPKLEEYLQRHSNELSSAFYYKKQSIHPILDRNFFLDAFHKLKLKEELDIHPWSFKQRVGEAVIVPAGCPYQVRKLKSCVNVVFDFISPENAAACIRLSDEISFLPPHHKAKGKVLEVKKMALYGINSAIEAIQDFVHKE